MISQVFCLGVRLRLESSRTRRRLNNFKNFSESRLIIKCVYTEQGKTDLLRGVEANFKRLGEICSDQGPRQEKRIHVRANKKSNTRKHENVE